MKWADYRNSILERMDYEAFYLNALTNIERRGYEFKASCPFTELHQNKADTHPSLTVNLDKGVYYCQACHSKGNIHTFMVKHYKMTAEEAWFAMGDTLKLERPKGAEVERPPIEPGLPIAYHRDLMALNAPIRQVLSERRGLTDDTLRRFSIGWDKERITIPIYDEFNELRNIRRYAWNAASGADKMRNYKDAFENAYGEARIYGIENLMNPTVRKVIWCEGEMDRIVAEQYGFPAATPTSGAGTFNPEWTKLFRGKEALYILQDNDVAGQRAAIALAEHLYRVVPVFIVPWPTDFPDKGDITDFFVAWKRTPKDFQDMLDTATQYTAGKRAEIVEDDGVEEVHLAESSDHTLMGKRMKIAIMCSGKDTAPYIAPRVVKITCTPGSGAKCGSCENAAFGGEQVLTFGATNPETLSLIQCSTAQQQGVLKEVAKINPKCTSFKIDISSYMNIEEIRVIPQAEVNFDFIKEHDYVVRKCFYICETMDKELKANQRYTMTGYSHAEPKTQYVTHIFDEATANKNRIALFEVTPELVERLKVFQPAIGQTIREKFEEMHTDFERNVTYVWERRKVGMALDLIYHTALCFYFQGQFVKRGWGELLVIGDSGQAKSTLIERIMGHYQLGELHSGESSKRTGLVYSFQQTQKRWFLIWGAWPLNDTGLLVIDEFSGINVDEIAAMSDVRSSGIAKVTGVITAETNARTRAVFSANPRNGRPLNTEPYGVQAALKLMGKAEDVRRLDMAIAVASGDVPIELINRSIENIPAVPHIYTTDLCRDRVLWCWSRKPDDLVFTPAAASAILTEATAMGRKYSAKIPLVEPADQRIKLARLSIAAAGATFSSPDGYKLVVDKCHVDFVVELLQEVYDDPNFAYDAYSKTNNDNEIPADRLKLLRRKFALLPVQDVMELAEILANIQYFKRQVLQDATGLAQEEVLKVMHFITLHKIIEDSMSGYRKTPNGTQFLKYMLANPVSPEELKEIRGVRHKSSEF